MRTAEDTLDRRVRRTKKRLNDALLSLIEERDYDEITVDGITERADVGRSTFYTHFTSKEDLLFAGFDEWLLSLPDDAMASALDPLSRRHVTPPSPAVAYERKLYFSLPLLMHVATQRRFILVGLFDGTNVRLRRKIMRLMLEVVRKELINRTPRTKPKDLDPQAEIIAGAFMGLISWWLRSGQPIPATEADELFQKAISI